MISTVMKKKNPYFFWDDVCKWGKKNAQHNTTIHGFPTIYAQKFTNKSFQSQWAIAANLDRVHMQYLWINIQMATTFSCESNYMFNIGDYKSTTLKWY